MKNISYNTSYNHKIKMAHKKQILNKYNNINNINTHENKNAEINNIEPLKSNIFDKIPIIYDKKTCIINKSLSNHKYQNKNKNIKLKTKKIQSQKHKYINTNIMNWEIIEEINFNNWLHKKFYEPKDYGYTWLKFDDDPETETEDEISSF